MRENSPSLTAAAVAFRRAAHQLLDRPLVFNDPLATSLLGPRGLESLRSDPSRGNRGPLWTRFRAFLVVRSRIAEDALAAAVAAGVQQYVVLGAGLDTFAYRNPYPQLTVFEVDHPATQRWKHERLRAAGIAVPANVRHVPVDFTKQTLDAELPAAGFSANSSTAISWLGVTPYLEAETVWNTLRWAAAVSGDAGHIAFDYGSRPPWWRLFEWLTLRMLSRRVAAAGEPFKTLLDPNELRDRLTALGFTAVEDFDSKAMNSRYFSGRTDGLRVGGSGHVMVATRRAATILYTPE